MIQIIGTMVTSSMDFAQDKRNHRRFPLSIGTELRLHNALPENTGVRGETRDVSASGAFFRVNEPIEVGEKIQFVLTFGPDLTTTNPLHVQFWGTVVRVEKSDDIGYRHGVAVQIRRYEFSPEAYSARTAKA
ncbi:MAG TPA: PilZ domain-containing protein [Clostridia bacterium]|nr:PilZ domain-containing protein [Clostridia bacterium]